MLEVALCGNSTGYGEDGRGVFSSEHSEYLKVKGLL